LRRIFLVFMRDYREMVSTKAFRIVCITAVVIILGLSIGVPVALHLQNWYGEQEARPVLDFIVALVIYFLTLIVLLTFTWGFSSVQITKEKVNGNIECLIATPLSPKALWAGKGLAVFAPGCIISLIAAVIVLAVLNLTTLFPGWDAVILPGPALVLGLLSNPVLFSGVLSFTILVSMVGNPDVAIMPSFLIGFGLMMGMPAGMATGVIDITSWSFVLWYTLGAFAVWIVVLFMIRMLTRQNIVLSSKGS
jgi:ABC-type Na+ efflux pump permease subunit